MREGREEKREAAKARGGRSSALMFRKSSSAGKGMRGRVKVTPRFVKVKSGKRRKKRGKGGCFRFRRGNRGRKKRGIRTQIRA